MHMANERMPICDLLASLFTRRMLECVIPGVRAWPLLSREPCVWTALLRATTIGLARVMAHGAGSSTRRVGAGATMRPTATAAVRLP